MYSATVFFVSKNKCCIILWRNVLPKDEVMRLLKDMATSWETNLPCSSLEHTEDLQDYCSFQNTKSTTSPGILHRYFGRILGLESRNTALFEKIIDALWQEHYTVRGIHFVSHHGCISSNFPIFRGFFVKIQCLWLRRGRKTLWCCSSQRCRCEV